MVIYPGPGGDVVLFMGREAAGELASALHRTDPLSPKLQPLMVALDRKLSARR